jgi:threonine dehydratase
VAAAPTIADGIAVKRPGRLTLALVSRWLDDVLTVGEDEVAEAMILLLERAKLVVEGAGAVGVAALLTGAAGGTGPACAVLSGGNIDPTLLISVLRHGLTVAGRYLVFRSHMADRPGELIKLLEIVAKERGNIVGIEHRREGLALDVAETEIEATVVMRNEEHCQRLIAELEEAGFPVNRIR